MIWKKRVFMVRKELVKYVRVKAYRLGLVKTVRSFTLKEEPLKNRFNKSFVGNTTRYGVTDLGGAFMLSGKVGQVISAKKNIFGLKTYSVSKVGGVNRL